MRRAAIALAVSSWTIAAALSAEESTFAVGDWVVVRGRLKECMAWENRIVDAVQVGDGGAVSLLDLGDFAVSSKTPRQVRAALLEAYERRAGKPLPGPLEVELVPAALGAGEFIAEAALSFEAMRSGSCKAPARDWRLRDLEFRIERFDHDEAERRKFEGRFLDPRIRDVEPKDLERVGSLALRESDAAFGGLREPLCP
jgi:hypothetical protein